MRAEAIATSDSWELRNSLVIHGRCREDLHWPSRKDDYTSYDDVAEVEVGTGVVSQLYNQQMRLRFIHCAAIPLY